MIENQERPVAEVHAKNRKKGWWIGLLLIILAAAGIWFGLHPYYRVGSAALLVIGVFLALRRDCWWWITVGAMLGVVVFLWFFRASGYKYTSLLPLAAAIMIVIFRFGARGLKIAASVLTGVGLTALLLVEIPIMRASNSEHETDANYVIVLGAAVYGTAPSVSLRNRLACALTYLEEHPNAKAVVSGGRGEGEDITEAACMYDWLIEKGVDPKRILMEENSTSTLENLTFSKSIIEQDGGDTSDIAIISSSYHLYRAKAMADSLGMDAAGIASSDGYPIYMCGMYLREALGVVKMWVFGARDRQACLASPHAMYVK